MCFNFKVNAEGGSCAARERHRAQSGLDRFQVMINNTKKKSVELSAHLIESEFKPRGRTDALLGLFAVR